MKRQISFSEKMNMYDKESLKYFAGDLWLSKVSQLRKADLIEKISEVFLDPEKMFYRLAILDDEAMELLKKGSMEPVALDPSMKEFDVACTLNEMEVANISEDHLFVTISDVWNIYENKIDNVKFETYRAKASWVWKCLRWVENMYAIAPDDVFIKVVNSKKKLHMTVEELGEIFDHFPDELVNTYKFDDVYIERIYAHNQDAAESLHRAQGNKDYYIPTASEVEEYFKTGALLSKKPYQDMLTFLRNDMKMDTLEAEDLLLELWNQITMEDDPHGVMQWFWDQFEFTNEAQVEKIVSLYMPLTNGTNLLINRGYAPSDMPRPMFKLGQMPTIVPGSSNAARMLEESMPELTKMGFGVDLDSNADTFPVFSMQNGIGGPVQKTEKKIYPNDPCPCGSGKKYKKCCGR